MLQNIQEQSRREQPELLVFKLTISRVVESRPQTELTSLKRKPSLLSPSVPPQMRKRWRTVVRPGTSPGVRCPVTALLRGAPHPEAPRAPEGSENTVR